MAWSERQAKRLRELTLEVSVREAARIMTAEGYRVTGSSALGYIHRNRVDFPHVQPRGDGIARGQGRSAGGRPKKKEADPCPAKRKSQPLLPLAEREREETLLRVVPDGKRVVISVELDPDPATARDLEPHDCRWPIGDPRDVKTFTFCGCRRVSGTSYCTHHLGRLRETPEQRRERLQEWRVLQKTREREAA